MSYFISTRWGGDEREPTAARVREVLSELDAEDDEHPSVSLTHESGWSLGVYPGGLFVWQNVEAADAPRHMNGVTRERVLELWHELAEGKIGEVEAESWRPGYEGLA